MDETIGPVAQEPNTTRTILESLMQNETTHVAALLWLRLGFYAIDVRSRTRVQLAQDLGVSVRTVARALKFLRALGLLQYLRQDNNGVRIYVVITRPDRYAERALAELAAGKISADGDILVHENRTVIDWEAWPGRAKGLDTTKNTENPERHGTGGVPPQHPEEGGVPPQHPPENSGSVSATGICPVEAGEGDFSRIYNSITVNGISSSTPSITDRNTSITGEKKKGRPRKTYVDPATDPRRADVEAVQAHANETFAVAHSLYTKDGEVLGRAKGGADGRYDVIHRALNTWGFTVDQLKLVLNQVKIDPWWSGRSIRDTIKIFRKLENVQDLLDKAERGEVGPYDRRAQHLGYQEVPKGKRTFTSERF